MAVYESGHFGRAVTIEEIEDLSLEGYQKEINDELGIEWDANVHNRQFGLTVSQLENHTEVKLIVYQINAPL